MTLFEKIESITPADEDARRAAQSRWDGIAHPLHSLGNLEDAVITLAAVSGSAQITAVRKALVIMCADNGVVEEGVTQTGQEVTAIVAENFQKEKATAAIMCRQTGTDLFAVDIGIARDTDIMNRKIAYGTKNMTKEPAMTREQTILAIETGMEMVRQLKEEGYGLIATGEMGIGNTTTSSAVTAVLLGRRPEEVTGRGAGLTTEGLGRKITAIQTAIEKNHPDPRDPIDVLSKVGGFDLAGLTGVFLGGAYYHVPIVLDGFISSAAALCAAKLVPCAAEYMIASHISKEPAARWLLQELGLNPSLCCNMSLGEGTGAIAFFPLVDLGIAVYQGMSTFDDNSIEQYEELL